MLLTTLFNKKISSASIKTACDLYVAIFSIAFGLKQIILSNGNVIKHFPGIGYDGLDWYTEGAFFVNWLFADPPIILPMIRPPVFVLICALDNVLGHAGYVLGAVTALCIFFTYWYSGKIVKLFYTPGRFTNFLYLPIAIGITLHPLNYFRTFISYADSLAITLSIIGFYFFVLHWKKDTLGNQSLLISMVIFLISGLTQTYALIPLFIGSFLFAIHALQKDLMLKVAIFPLAGALIVALLFIFIREYWYHLIPHEITAYNFSLLKISTNMSKFYLNAWTIFFFPIPIILFLCTCKISRQNFQSMMIYTVFITAASILTLAFFYQMPEARYTSYAWPWVVMLITILLSASTVKIVVASVLLTLPIAIVPANYWIPTLNTVRIQYAYKWNWLFDYFNAKSVNFDIKACEIECGDEWLSKYAKTYNLFNKVIIDKYKKSLVSD
jgi:hypothetical protein